MPRSEGKVFMLGALVTIDVLLATLAFAPAATAARTRACGDKGCVLDTCMSATGYNCSKAPVGGGCNGYKCEKT